MKPVLATVLCLTLSSCATFFKDSRQQVFFKGGPVEGRTIVNSPDGQVELEGGSGTYLMTRSKSDIPIKVRCPSGKQTQGIIETKFDVLVAGVLNVLFWPAWFYDPWQNKAYDIPEINIGMYCGNDIPEKAVTKN